MFKKVVINYIVMKEKTLLKISLIGSLAGILLLFIISGKLKVDEKVIAEIDETEFGSSVRISGVVADVKERGSVILINVAQLEQIEVVVFNANITLNKGDYVEVTGSLGEYEGNMQLIADKIVLK